MTTKLTMLTKAVRFEYFVIFVGFVIFAMCTLTWTPSHSHT